MQVIIDGVQYVPQKAPPTDKSLLAALDIRLDTDAGKNITVRDYLRQMSVKLWTEQDGFNSKRPYGNGSWAFDLYLALVKGGFIPGELDSDGYVSKLDTVKAKAYVSDLVNAAFLGVAP